MIASLRGQLSVKESNWIIVDVAGVGFLVSIPLSTYYKLPAIGETVSLHIAMMVREDMISLYGFFTPAEKKLFQLLLSVSKVGPKLANNILSGIGTEDLVNAIQSENVLVIKAIPGVGLKTAERIILELKGKIGAEIVMTGTETMTLDQDRRALFDDVLAALIALGYRRSEAQDALKKALKEEATAASMETLVKSSLLILARRNKS